MSEFMLILPHDPARDYRPQGGDDSPAAILNQLENSLAALDRVGAGLAAAYLAMAIDQARAHFGHTGDSSGSE